MSTLKVRATIFILIATLVIQTLSHDLHLHKRSFSNICDGKYDIALYARSDRVCEECYELYKDTELHRQCKSKCFINDTFDKCVEALMPKHEADILLQRVKKLSKREVN